MNVPKCARNSNVAKCTQNAKACCTSITQMSHHRTSHHTADCYWGCSSTNSKYLEVGVDLWSRVGRRVTSRDRRVYTRIRRKRRQIHRVKSTAGEIGAITQPILVALQQLFTCLLTGLAKIAALFSLSALARRLSSASVRRRFSARNSAMVAALTTAAAVALSAAAFMASFAFSVFAIWAAADLLLSVLYAPRMYGCFVRGLMPSFLCLSGDATYTHTHLHAHTHFIGYCICQAHTHLALALGSTGLAFLVQATSASKRLGAVRVRFVRSGCSSWAVLFSCSSDSAPKSTASKSIANSSSSSCSGTGAALAFSAFSGAVLGSPVREMCRTAVETNLASPPCKLLAHRGIQPFHACRRIIHSDQAVTVSAAILV